MRTRGDLTTTRPGHALPDRPTLAGKGEQRIKRASSRRRAGLRVSRALARSEIPGEIKAAAAMRECSDKVLWLVRPCACPDPAVKAAGRIMCHDRMCGTCAAQRARRLGADLERKVRALIEAEKGTRAVFLTLTIRNTPEISGATVGTMWTFYRRLRQRKIWRQVGGSAASIEFTNRGNGWHPHIHALLILPPGAWLADQADWSREWAEITGGSGIVDIRPVRGSRLAAAVREVAKYAAKAPELEDDLAILELHRAISGRRLWVTTGNLRGVVEGPDPEEFAPDDDLTGTCPKCDVAAEPVLVRWSWDWHRSRYREESVAPTVGIEGDRRAMWGEAPDPWPPRPRPDAPEPTPEAKENALVAMVARAFGPQMGRMGDLPKAEAGNAYSVAVAGRKGDRYRGACRCGFTTAGAFSQPGMAVAFVRTAHTC